MPRTDVTGPIADTSLEALRQRLAQLEQFLADGLPVQEARDEVRRQIDFQLRADSSHHFQVAQGDNNVQMYIERYVESAERITVATLFRDYVGRVWEELIRLPILVARDRTSDSAARGAEGSDAERKSALAAVYTALDVETTLTASASSRMARFGDREATLEFLRRGLLGNTELPDTAYAASLIARFRAEVVQQAERRGLEGAAILENGEFHFERRMTALEAAACFPRLVLLGAMGSGKSTFARYLALCMAGELDGRERANLTTLNQPLSTGRGHDEEPSVWHPWPHGAMLPVFVELRDFVTSADFPPHGVVGSSEHLIAYLVHRGQRPMDAGFKPRFLDYLQKGKTLLILDGLDEVPDAETCCVRLRHVIEGFVGERYPGCRVLVTSRPYAYDDPELFWNLDGLGFTVQRLGALDDQQLRVLLEHRYHYLAQINLTAEARATKNAADLWEQIRREPYLRQLADRPIMAAMMADVAAAGGGILPPTRTALYEESVKLMIDRWNSARLGEDTLATRLHMAEADVRRAIEALAFEVHGRYDPERPESGHIEHKDVWDHLRRYRTKRGGDAGVVPDYEGVINYLHERSGILEGIQPGKLRFPHRSFQEYMAACHLTKSGFPNSVRDVAIANPALWREVVLFAAGRSAESPFTAWALLQSLVPKGPPPRLTSNDPAFMRALFAALAVEESRLYVDVEETYQQPLEWIRQWLKQALTIGALSPADRALGGRVLALLGDDRLGVSCRGAVPDISWYPRLGADPLPAVVFDMGEETIDVRVRRELLPPRRQTAVNHAFRISRHPITVAQWKPFVADGYRMDRFWTAAGLAWRGGRTEPMRWLHSDVHVANHPVVDVTWYEADAYCSWLSEQLGFLVRLPTETEWEYAARGTDNRIWPWGNAFDASRCNMGDTGIGQTSSVGMFPLPDGPWGADGPLDMVGNVWEWCASKWRTSYVKSDEDNDREGDAARVLRGGSFIDTANLVRCACRIRSGPVGAADNVGFRVVAPFSSAPLASVTSDL